MAMGSVIAKTRLADSTRQWVERLLTLQILYLADLRKLEKLQKRNSAA